MKSQEVEAIFPMANSKLNIWLGGMKDCAERAGACLL
jgi:hypothetical protein